MTRCRVLLLVSAVCVALVAVPVPALAAPGEVWAALGQSWASFSADGTLALVAGNTSSGGRLEIRQANNGATLRVLTSPVKFNAMALSADKQIAAVTLTDTSTGTAVRTIRVYRVSDGALLRAIPTVAERELTSIDFSPDGRLVAAMDRRSYERGGQVHIHRVTDGATVRVLTVPAITTAAVRFSPDGRYLAANDRFSTGGSLVSGVRVFRTSDWTSVLTLSGGTSRTLIRWAADGGAIWTQSVQYLVPTAVRLVSVPAGVVQRSVDLDWYDSVSDVSDDGSLLFTNPVVAPRRSLTFTSTLDGADVATYEFGQDVFAGDVSPSGTLFSYTRTTAPSAFDLHVATMSA